KKQGKRVKAGFPRFKSIDRYKSITYPQDNGSFSIQENHKGKGAYLRVSRIGNMKIELHKDIEGTIKTMTIKREGRKYYAIFTAVNNSEVKKVEDARPVGIDLGLNSFIAMSDGK
ncbi:transposase, IS605 OrfB family, partial [mine drainage metagenome]